jgi:hypothetical protein
LLGGAGEGQGGRFQDNGGPVIVGCRWGGGR